MSIEVDFDGIKATSNDGTWTTNKSTDREGMMEESLNALLSVNLTQRKYGTIEARDVDYFSALAMTKEFRGKITDLSKHTMMDYAEPSSGIVH